MGQPGFFDLDERYRGLDAKKDPLVFLNEVVPWEDFRARLSAVWRKPEEERKNAAGRKPRTQALGRDRHLQGAGSAGALQSL
jgi:hypothetical protein